MQGPCHIFRTYDDQADVTKKDKEQYTDTDELHITQRCQKHLIVSGIVLKLHIVQTVNKCMDFLIQTVRLFVELSVFLHISAPLGLYGFRRQLQIAFRQTADVLFGQKYLVVCCPCIQTVHKLPISLLTSVIVLHGIGAFRIQIFFHAVLHPVQRSGQLVKTHIAHIDFFYFAGHLID